MSDQNHWPKPDETDQGGRGTGTPGDDRSSEQHGASAPSSDPWAQSGQGAAAQGVSEGQTAAQDPSAAPGQQSGNPYAVPGQQSGRPYAVPGQQAGNPYGVPGQQSGNPYAVPGQQAGNPYAAPGNPYAAPGQQTGHGAPQNPYGQQPGTNPYGQQPGTDPYGQQPAANPYAAPGAYAPLGYQPYAQRPRTNVLAILAIVFAFGGIIIWPLIILTSPAGAIMGHLALGKIKQTGEAGRGLALAGVIGGWVLTGLYILIVGLFVIFGVIAGTSGGYSDSNGFDSGAFIG